MYRRTVSEGTTFSRYRVQESYDKTIDIAIVHIAWLYYTVYTRGSNDVSVIVNNYAPANRRVSRLLVILFIFFFYFCVLKHRP